MKKFTFVLAILTVLFSNLYANNQETIVTKSAYSVEETMNKIEAILKEKGLTIFARINHQENAQKVGMEMNPSELIIFGNPKAGTLIMQKDIKAGLDLPVKLYAYENKDSEVYLSYKNPQLLQKEYVLKECKVIAKLQTALNNIAQNISK